LSKNKTGFPDRIHPLLLEIHKKFPNKQAKFNHEERLYTLSSPHKMEKTECTFAQFTWQILRSYDRLPSTAITLSIGENQYKAVRPVTPAAAEYGG
jgi:hypothetical protein